MPTEPAARTENAPPVKDWPHRRTALGTSRKWWRLLAIVLAWPVLAGLWLFIYYLLNAPVMRPTPAETFSYQASQRLAGMNPFRRFLPNKVTLIRLDAKTFGTNVGPLTHRAYVPFLKRSRGAAAVFMDLSFSVCQDLEVERDFTKAIRINNKVYLANYMEEQVLLDNTRGVITNQRQRVAKLICPLLDAGRAAVVWAELDENEHEKVYRLVTCQPEKADHFSPAWAIAKDLNASNLPPPDSGEWLWLNYHGITPSFSGQSLTDTNGLPTLLAGQVLVVGDFTEEQHGTGRPDRHLTPFGEMFGAEINALAIQNLCDGDYWRRPPAWFPVLTSLVLGFLVWWSMPEPRTIRWRRLAIVLGVTVLIGLLLPLCTRPGILWSWPTQLALPLLTAKILWPLLPGPKPRVFISYKTEIITQRSSDKETKSSDLKNTRARTLRAELERRGCLCWLAPDDCSDNIKWLREVETAIRGANNFVLILDDVTTKYLKCPTSPVARELDMLWPSRKTTKDACLDAAHIRFQILLVARLPIATVIGTDLHLQGKACRWKGFEHEKSVHFSVEKGEPLNWSIDQLVSGFAHHPDWEPRLLVTQSVSLLGSLKQKLYRRRLDSDN